jgi:hypothetical protein
VPLILPAIPDAPGSLTIGRGGATARRYHVEASVCPNPLCQCDGIRLCLFPKGTRGSAAAVRLYLDLRKSRISNLKGLKWDPASASLAKTLAAHLKASDWEKLRDRYIAAKLDYTDRTDWDQVEIPKAAMKNARSPVGYDEIIPYNDGIGLRLGSDRWVVRDHYCVDPKCSCADVILVFFRMDQATGAREERPRLLCLCDHRTGKVTREDPQAEGSPSAEDFLRAMRRARPKLAARLGERQARLRKLFRRAIDERVIPAKAVRAGHGLAS